MGEYSTKNCVECRGELTALTTVAVTLDLDAGPASIPGLYRCANCQALMSLGIISSNITEEEAFDYLAGYYIPQMSAGIMMKGNSLPPVVVAIAVQRINDAIDIADELIRRLGGEGDGAEEVELTPEDAKAIIESVADSIRFGEDGGTTFQCPGCGGRHDVERLFSLLDQLQRPEADAA